MTSAWCTFPWLLRCALTDVFNAQLSSSVLSVLIAVKHSSGQLSSAYSSSAWLSSGQQSSFQVCATEHSRLRLAHFNQAQLNSAQLSSALRSSLSRIVGCCSNVLFHISDALVPSYEISQEDHVASGQVSASFADHQARERSRLDCTSFSAEKELVNARWRINFAS